MNNFVHLSPKSHKRNGFRPAENLSHAFGDMTVPVVLEEIPELLSYMPLCFRAHPQAKNKFELVALLGLTEGVNFFCHPANQKWLANYVPAFYRGYPFCLMPVDNESRSALAVERTEMEPVDDVSGVEPFFNVDGSLTEKLNKTLEFLKALQSSFALTQAAVDQLHVYNLIVPWEITLRQKGIADVELKGCFRVDTEQLNQCSPEVLRKLQQSNSLKLAYGQTFSHSRLKHLAKLNDIHRRFADGDNADVDLDAMFQDDNEFKF